MASIAPRGRGRGGAHLWLAAAGLLVVLACLAVLGLAMIKGQRPVARHPPPPAIATPAPRPDDATVLLDNTPLAIAPADAIAINAARRLDRVRLTAARPFPPAAVGIGAGAALDCLSQAIYYEAASESDAGEAAVAQVVLNRVRNPLFPKTICGVVFQGAQQRTGCQFSFTCDGSLDRRPSAAGWARARRIALAALDGRVSRKVGLSTHYHANYVVPYWASSLDKVATIGAHIFYVMRGNRGRAASFNEPYDAAAEAPPVVILGPEAIDALTGGETAGALADPDVRNRTIVAEDTLGVPRAALAKPEAAAGALRADDSAGELLIDQARAPAGTAH